MRFLPTLLVLALLGPGCTQPLRVDDDVPANDVPLADVPASPDAGADVPAPMDTPADTLTTPDVPPPLDAPNDVPLPLDAPHDVPAPRDAPVVLDCDATFGMLPSYMNCGATATSCTFTFGRTSCDATCADAGWRCVTAYDDEPAGTCMPGPTIPCSLSRLSAICVCEMPS
jgi:hypothetical protein